MTRYHRAALKKLKAAKLTPLEAQSMANWMAQSVASYVSEHTGLSDKDFFTAQNEIAQNLVGKE